MRVCLLHSDYLLEFNHIYSCLQVVELRLRFTNLPQIGLLTYQFSDNSLSAAKAFCKLLLSVSLLESCYIGDLGLGLPLNSTQR